MRRTGRDEAEIGGGVARQRAVRRPAWFRRKEDIPQRVRWAGRARWRLLLADRMARATGNRVEGARLVAG